MEENAGRRGSRRETRNIGSYILGVTLGEGAFGKVKLGTHMQTNEKVAIKILDKIRMQEDEEDIVRVQREIAILKRMRHKNIIQLYEIMESNRNIYLVMEYCEGKELFDYIVMKKRLSEAESLKFFHEIVDAIEYLHSQNIVHRDLKPENLLLDSKLSIKVSDFGLSRTYDNENLLSTPCGTPSYAPPEMLKGEEYHGLLSDVWSAGVILYAMLSGYLPFSESNEELNCQKIINCVYEIPEWVSEPAVDLLNQILKQDPLDRFDIEQIKEHPWFNSCAPSLRSGIIIGLHKIPIDNFILKQVAAYGYASDKVRFSLENNKFDVMTAIYYLILKKHIVEGGRSVSDLQSEEFMNFISDEANLISNNIENTENQRFSILEERTEVELPPNSNQEEITQVEETEFNSPKTEFKKDEKITMNATEESTEYNPYSIHNVTERFSMKLAGRRSLYVHNNLEKIAFREPEVEKLTGRNKRRSVATSGTRKRTELDDKLLAKRNSAIDTHSKTIQLLNETIEELLKTQEHELYENKILDTINNVDGDEEEKKEEAKEEYLVEQLINTESDVHSSEEDEEDKGDSINENLIVTIKSNASLGEAMRSSIQQANKVVEKHEGFLKEKKNSLNSEIKTRKKASTIAAKPDLRRDSQQVRRESQNKEITIIKDRENKFINKKNSNKNKGMSGIKDCDTSIERSPAKTPDRNLSYSPNNATRQHEKRIEIVPWKLKKKVIDNPEEKKEKIIGNYNKYKDQDKHNKLKAQPAKKLKKEKGETNINININIHNLKVYKLNDSLMNSTSSRMMNNIISNSEYTSKKPINKSKTIVDRKLLKENKTNDILKTPKKNKYMSNNDLQRIPNSKSMYSNFKTELKSKSPRPKTNISLTTKNKEKSVNKSLNKSKTKNENKNIAGIAQSRKRNYSNVSKNSTKGLKSQATLGLNKHESSYIYEYDKQTYDNYFNPKYTGKPMNKKVFSLIDKDFKNIKYHNGPVDFSCCIINISYETIQKTIEALKSKKIIYIQTSPYKFRCSKIGTSFDIEIFKLSEVENCLYYHFKQNQGDGQTFRSTSKQILEYLNK